MASLGLSFSVKHDVNVAASQIGRYPERMDKAMRDATPDATQALAKHAERIIVGMAGGSYWKIETDVQPGTTGSTGHVTTGPNSPHVILPTKPGGVLVFEVDGQLVFTKRVNHPGSNPPNWIAHLNQPITDDLGGYYAREVGKVFGGSVSSAMPVGSL